MQKKRKKLLPGCELEGKKLGVIGLGAIGVLVANAATHLGMEVYGYDPYISVDSAWRLSRSIRMQRRWMRYIKIVITSPFNVPATDATKNMIDKMHLVL